MADETAINAQADSAVEKAAESAVESITSFEQEIHSFLRRLFSGDKELWAESKILKMSLLSFLLISACGFILYLLFLEGQSGFASRLPFLAYSALSAVAITASVAHYRAHKGQFTCMEGMMIGMTIGMMAGFLFGAIIGATNGMFSGSVFGMAVGIVAGAYCGKCCGIMGVMEGMMAGLMGGTMGAMLTVMMITDRVLLFMPLFVISCLAILAGLTYMVYNTAGKRVEKQLMGFGKFFAVAIFLFLLTLASMLLAPRGPITI